MSDTVELRKFRSIHRILRDVHARDKLRGRGPLTEADQLE